MHNQQPDLDALLRTVPTEEADSLREVWNLLGDEEPSGFPEAHIRNVDRRRLEAVMESAPEMASSSAERSRRYRDRGPRVLQQSHLVWRGAVVLATLLILGLIGIFWWQQPVTVTAQPGERLAVVLPDGSRAELNSGSSLRYDRHFGAVRAVRLDGEAFFDVMAGERPFVVHTFNTEVRVVGTRFGVRAWSSRFEDATTVALETGRIALAPAGQPELAVIMKPGEIRRVEGTNNALDLPPVSALSVGEATAWRQGDLIAKDQPLGIILEDVERRFAVHLQVQPVSLSQRRLGLVLRQPAGAEAVVRDLAAALGLRYRATSDGYELYTEE